MKQVYKIEGLLEKKLNELVYYHFDQKKEYEEAVRIKKSLEKLKKTVRETPSAADKLKFLIRYKQEKRF